MEVTIQYPTERPNFSIVKMGDIGLAFSYETLVGVTDRKRPWRVIRNYWGPTTGKHLNYLDDGDKSSRLDSEAFNQQAAEVLGRLEIGQWK